MQSLLIIDDEPNVCYTLEKVLGSAELKILTAGTAATGVELVRRESPDAVILDVRLPDMSGLDAYRQIRQIDARLPVIIITAHGTTETAIEATKLGAFDYLLKPLDLEQLRDVVARAVHLSQISRTPAMYDENGPPQVESDQTGGQLAAHAGALQVDRPDRPAGRDRADPGRKRDGQGDGCPGHLPAQPPQPGPAAGHQLRGNSRAALGKRAFRPRARRVHRRRPPPHRQVRAGRRRNHLHG